MGEHRPCSSPFSGRRRDRICRDARCRRRHRAGVSHERPAGHASDRGWTRAGQLLVLRGATVLDGLGGRVVKARVTIRDHRITEVTLDDDRVALPDGAVVENLGGRYLIPGLFDSHVHWADSAARASPRSSAPTIASPAISRRPSPPASPSVVSLTDDLAGDERARRGSRVRALAAPRTFFAGPSITARAGTPPRCSRSCPASPSSSRGRWRRPRPRARRSPNSNPRARRRGEARARAWIRRSADAAPA